MAKTEEEELNKAGTTMCRVYNETFNKIKQYKGRKTIAVFITEAVDEYVKSTQGQGVIDRIAAIEASQRKIELSNETALGLLVNALGKLNLLDEKK